MHADMDAFFVSVEVRDKPWLKGKPVAVSGDISTRSVIATASYEARKCGVHSAMPIFKALNLCPNLILIKADHKKYEEVSAKIIKTLSSYSPSVETASIDEAFLDLTYISKDFEEAKTVGEKIKNEIHAKFRLPLTIGISSNKLLSKLASKIGKPNGLKIILPEEKDLFLKNTPIEKISGIGTKTAKLLKHKFGVQTPGDLREIPLLTLYSTFKSRAIFLYNAARGIDTTPIIPDYEKEHQKSIGNSMTLPFDTNNTSYLYSVLKHLSYVVAKRLRENKLYAQNIIITVRYSDFRTITRQVKIRPTNTSKVIYLISIKILKEVQLNRKIRLLGITASNLISSPVITLFESFDKREEIIDKTMDILKAKYGKNITNYATLMNIKQRT